MKSDFSVAVHALVYLSVKGCTLSSDALARQHLYQRGAGAQGHGPPEKGRPGGRREGSEGGFCPQVPPAELTLDRVAAAVDTAFVESGWHSGAADRNCAICAGMAGVMDEIYADLDAGCRRRLAGVTIADIEDRLFAGKPLFAAEPGVDRWDLICPSASRR